MSIKHRPFAGVVVAAALAGLPLPALAQDDDARGDPQYFIEIPANTRAELYLGREPATLLVCLVGGTRASVDISSERVSRAVLERDECVLVSEREVFATVAQGDGAAELSVRLIRD